MPPIYSTSNTANLFWQMLIMLGVAFLFSMGPVSSQAQEAVLKGKIQFKSDRKKAFTGEELNLDFTEMKARLREYVDLPAPKFPDDFQQRTPEQRTKWIQEFAKSEAGKKHIERNKKLLAAANSFEIKFETDGSFVVYDVPAGRWAIQGRVDKTIGEITYAFEVFGELQVQKKVDELALAPMKIEITPLLKRGNPVPPIEVKTFDQKDTLTLAMFKDKYLFVNFWSIGSPTVKAEQAMVQKAFQNLKEKYPLRMLSVNVDSDVKKATNFLVTNQLREGSHGFAGGINHPAVFYFGARRFPSFWLISPDGKILMSHSEFVQTMSSEPDFKMIIANRIDGKDEPTLAPQPQQQPDSDKQ